MKVATLRVERRYEPDQRRELLALLLLLNGQWVYADAPPVQMASGSLSSNTIADDG